MMAIIAAASICAAVPASAEDVGVGVGVGPVGAGVTVGSDHRNRDRDRTTVIRESKKLATKQWSLRSATGNLIAR